MVRINVLSKRSRNHGRRAPSKNTTNVIVFIIFVYGVRQLHNSVTFKVEIKEISSDTHQLHIMLHHCTTLQYNHNI